MRESGVGITVWLINMFNVFLAVGFSSMIGHFKFDPTNAYYSLIGGYSLYFLTWFGAGRSFTWSVFIMFVRRPWRKIKPPIRSNPRIHMCTNNPCNRGIDICRGVQSYMATQGT